MLRRHNRSIRSSRLRAANNPAQLWLGGIVSARKHSSTALSGRDVASDDFVFVGGEGC